MLARLMDSPESAVADLAELVPELRGVRSIAELPGGLTNANHRVQTDSGAYVVRRWSDDTGLLAIDRDNEYENSVKAAEVGIGPRVVAYLPERNTMVVGCLEGTTLSAEDLRRGDRLEAIAAACRRLHGAARFRDDFNMFDIQPRYLGIVRERDFRLPERYDEFEPQVAALREAMAIRDEGPSRATTTCWPRTSSRRGPHVLIDYEYSGNNDASSSWATSGVSRTCRPSNSTSSSRVLRAPAAQQRSPAPSVGVMSKYGWTLWASIQDGVSTIDFDFWEWGMEKYERAVAEFDGPDFERLLEDVQRSD